MVLAPWQRCGEVNGFFDGTSCSAAAAALPSTSVKGRFLREVTSVPKRLRQGWRRGRRADGGGGLNQGWGNLSK